MSTNHSTLLCVCLLPCPGKVDELSKECENGRLMRLMVKLDQIHNRTEEDMVSRVLGVDWTSSRMGLGEDSTQKIGWEEGL